MPDKEGSDDEKKSTKSVVNKKQKQMMNKEEYTIEMVRKIKKKISARAVFPRVTQNKVRDEILKGDDLKIDNKNPVKKQKKNLDEEGYDVARDEGRVRPSKDKKDATTMPVSDEVKKTQKVNKGPSALERVKSDIEKKYGKGAIMNVKKKETKEELDLTQVAEAFGGYIIEAPIDAEGNITPKKGEAKKIKKKISKIEKKVTAPKPGETKKATQTLQKFIKSTSGAAAKNKAEGDKLLQDINKRKSADLTRADAINRSMGTSGSTEGAGGANTGTPPVTGGKKRSTDDPKRTKQVVQQSLPGMEGGGGKKKRSDAGKSRGRYRRKYFADPSQLQLDLTNPKDREQIKQDVAKVVKQPGKTARAALQRTFLTKDKGVRGLLKSIRKEPISTAIAGGIARDSFRMPQLPPMPKLQGGKVGKRTAG